MDVLAILDKMELWPSWPRWNFGHLGTRSFPNCFPWSFVDLSGGFCDLFLPNLAKPGTIKPHSKAKAQIYVLTKDEGGRHTPFFKGYRPQFFFGTADVTGVVELPDGVEMVMPGDNLEVNMELQKSIAMESGQRFAIREGGKTIGAGNITEVTS